ncbi:MAG: peptide ABC transporter substrate-binding protein [Gemmatimonadaceae bacterium]|nr:peptide ABC transporter substrate-binding protein [Gemmatimonadaceae bacterium]
MTHRPLIRRSIAGIAIGMTAACGGSGDSSNTGADGGTLIAVVPAEPQTLLPPLVTVTHDAAIVSTIFDKLADIGPAFETYGDGGFRPRLAKTWQWAPDSMSIAFAIDSSARWHDGPPVTAADVQYTFRVYTSDSVGSEFRSLVSNIDSVSTVGTHTAVFWFKRRTPQQFYDATYHMHVLPSHLLDTIPMSGLAASSFARSPVGSGRFRFMRWDPAQRVEVIADTTHPQGRPHLDRVIWSIAPDFGAATVKLFAGEADFFESIRPENLAQVARTPALRLADNRALQYSFLGFNMRNPAAPNTPHPIFGDPVVRRALSMAVDRERIVRNVYDSLGMVALAPAPRALIPDTTAFKGLPHDLARARAMLDSAGWRDTDNDGVRERNGVALAFDVLVPNSSAARQRLAILLQEQLKAVGAKVTPQILEINTLVSRIDSKKFDSYMGGWASSPGLVGMPQTWSSKGAANSIGYRNTAFDAAVDSALTTFDRTTSHRLWARAFQLIIDDAPAIWLAEQTAPVAIHRRFIIPPLRPDGWYSDLAEWRVDPAQRIDRDRIGLGGASR